MATSTVPSSATVMSPAIRTPLACPTVRRERYRTPTDGIRSVSAAATTLGTMRPDADHWATPVPSTTNTAALAAYHDGLAALIAGSGHAEAMLRAAVDHDPDFLLACVALGVAGVLRRLPYEAGPLPPTATRAERQHAEVVRTTMCGDQAHADDLRREHLSEFPGDLLVVWLPTVGLRQASRDGPPTR